MATNATQTSRRNWKPALVRYCPRRCVSLAGHEGYYESDLRWGILLRATDNVMSRHAAGALVTEFTAKRDGCCDLQLYQSFPIDRSVTLLAHRAKPFQFARFLDLNRRRPINTPKYLVRGAGIFV